MELRGSSCLGRNDNLYELSGSLDQYKGFVISDIDAVKNTVSFTNGVELQCGEATGDVNELALRRIQIREAIRSLRERQQLFSQGIKVLSLFFIDEVVKYRQYDDEGEKPGEYASIFEEEYRATRWKSDTLWWSLRCLSKRNRPIKDSRWLFLNR